MLVLEELASREDPPITFVLKLPEESISIGALIVSVSACCLLRVLRFCMGIMAGGKFGFGSAFPDCGSPGESSGTRCVIPSRLSSVVRSWFQSPNWRNSHLLRCFRISQTMAETRGYDEMLVCMSLDNNVVELTPRYTVRLLRTT